MKDKTYGWRVKSVSSETLLNAIQDTRREGQKLIDQIVAGFTDRSRKDIDKWRKAIKAMEDPYYPNRKEYHELIRDLLIDNHASAQIDIRKLSMMGSKFHVLNKIGEVDTVMTHKLHQPWFLELMDAYMETKVSGTEVIEIGEIMNREIQSIFRFPKTRIIPEKKEVMKYEFQISGIRYDAPEYEDFIIEIGKVTDYGFMYKIAPQIIWKRNAQQAWAEFSQLFGMPLRYAHTNKRDQASLDLLQDMLHKLGEAGEAVFPIGTEIKFIESVKTDSFNVYDKQIDRCNSEISKAINGVTMISDDGSSRSQSETHFKVNAQIMEADRVGFEMFINSPYIKDKLIKIGYPMKDCTFEFNRTENLSREAQWKIVNEASQHFEIEPEWVEKTFGFPIIGVKSNQPNLGLPQNFYRGPAHPAVQGLIMLLPDYGKSCCPPKIQNISLNRYEKLFGALVKQVFEKENAAIPLENYQEKARLLNSAFKAGFEERLKNIEYNSPDHYRLAMFQANIFKFSAASEWDTVKRLNEIRKTAKGFDDFAQQAQALGVAKNRALLAEYNFSEAVAQNSANWLRQVAEKDLFDLRYQTVGDSQVRPEHASLDGFTAPVDDAIWDTIYAPNGWNCRCEVIQIPKGTVGRSDDSKIDMSSIKPEFRKNRGKLNVVFEANQSYLKEFPEVNKFNRRTFGLETWADLDRSKLNPAEFKLQDKNAYANWWQEQSERTGGRDIYYTDFLGRSHRLNSTKLLNKFDGDRYKGQNRWGIAEHVKDIMQNPDEVWMTEQNRKNNRYNTVFLKNYKDRLLAVIAGSEEDNVLDVITWYEVAIKEELIGNERKGIIIKKAGK